MAPSSPTHATPIDALIAAARLFGKQLSVLLPVILLLEVTKAGILLGLIAWIGEDLGSLTGSIVAAVLLATVVGIGALVAIDAHDGFHAASSRDLLTAARPFVIAFGLGALAAWLSGAPALLFGLGAGLLTPWIQSARRGEAPGLGVRESAKLAAQMARTALLSTVLLLAFYRFSIHLIPALTDSLVGRKAPNSVWLPVESLISALVLPIVAMAIVIWYLELDDRRLESSAPAPAPTSPILPGTRPTSPTLPGMEQTSPSLPGMAPTFVKPARAR